MNSFSFKPGKLFSLYLFVLNEKIFSIQEYHKTYEYQISYYFKLRFYFRNKTIVKKQNINMYYAIILIFFMDVLCFV